MNIEPLLKDIVDIVFIFKDIVTKYIFDSRLIYPKGKFNSCFVAELGEATCIGTFVTFHFLFE